MLQSFSLNVTKVMQVYINTLLWNFIGSIPIIVVFTNLHDVALSVLSNDEDWHDFINSQCVNIFYLLPEMINIVPPYRW